MRPLCDTPAYERYGKCVALTDSKYNGLFLSVPSHNKNIKA